MGAPTIYHAGETVICPGAKHDRRTADRGDRRAEPRPTVPCRHRWGRVGPGTEVEVGIVRGHQSNADPAHPRALVVPPRRAGTMILECPDCHQPIEFATVAAREAA